MSKSLKFVTANVFILSVLSYLCQLLMTPTAQDSISKLLRDFILPVSVARLSFLSHMNTMFGITASLHDPVLTNVAAILATSQRLCHRPGMSLADSDDQDMHELLYEQYRRIRRDIARATHSFWDARGSIRLMGGQREGIICLGGFLDRQKFLSKLREA